MGKLSVNHILIGQVQIETSQASQLISRSSLASFIAERNAERQYA